jgi:hypothetical protein
MDTNNETLEPIWRPWTGPHCDDGCLSHRPLAHSGQSDSDKQNRTDAAAQLQQTGGLDPSKIIGRQHEKPVHWGILEREAHDLQATVVPGTPADQQAVMICGWAQSTFKAVMICGWAESSRIS